MTTKEKLDKAILGINRCGRSEASFIEVRYLFELWKKEQLKKPRYKAGRKEREAKRKSWPRSYGKRSRGK